MAVTTGQALAYNARQVGHSDMDDRGYCVITDYNAGLYIVELEGEARQLMGLDI
jgi:hypothetical protein